MSNNPPYPPPGGQPPYGPPPGQGGQPPYGPPPGQGGQPPGGYPQGGYPQGPPGYGQQPPPAYGPPGQPGQPAYGAPYAQPAYGLPPAPPSKRWYQRWWVWLVIVLGVIIVAAVVIGAVVGNKYALESKIKDVIQKQNVSISNVQCPNSIDTGAGHTYTCTAVVEGTPRKLTVDFVTDRNFTVTVQQ